MKNAKAAYDKKRMVEKGGWGGDSPMVVDEYWGERQREGI